MHPSACSGKRSFLLGWPGVLRFGYCLHPPLQLQLLSIQASCSGYLHVLSCALDCHLAVGCLWGCILLASRSRQNKTEQYWKTVLIFWVHKFGLLGYLCGLPHADLKDVLGGMPSCRESQWKSRLRSDHALFPVLSFFLLRDVWPVKVRFTNNICLHEFAILITLCELRTRQETEGVFEVGLFHSISGVLCNYIIISVWHVFYPPWYFQWLQRLRAFFCYCSMY